MAAKVNTTKHISLRDGSPDNKSQFKSEGVLGGGTRINTSGKTRGQAAAPANGNGYGNARGIQKSKGSTGSGN